MLGLLQYGILAAVCSGQMLALLPTRGVPGWKHWASVGSSDIYVCQPLQIFPGLEGIGI